MTGPAVNVEQQGSPEIAPTAADFSTAAMFMRNARAAEGAGEYDAVWTYIATALAVERAKHTDLIRRQDAALTAVRELADEWARDYDHPAGYDSASYAQGIADEQHSRALRAALALASPDTTQEAVVICDSRGPRIGEEGCPRCRQLQGHDGPHRPAPEDGWGDVTWRDL